MAAGSRPASCKRLGGGGNRQGHDARNMLALAGIHPGQFVELRNFARDMHRQVGRIEAGNALHARLARQNGAAEGFLADAIGTDHAHAGNNDAREHAGFSHTVRSGLPAEKMSGQLRPEWDNQ